MRYYIVDDNIATVKNLENIIISRNLGTVCGYSTSPEAAISEILEERPEIVLVDFLMEEIDSDGQNDRDDHNGIDPGVADVRQIIPFINLCRLSHGLSRFFPWTIHQVCQE